MFKVIFNGQTFAELGTDVEAIQLAIALHQSSNKDHSVAVFKADDVDDPLLKLFK